MIPLTRGRKGHGAYGRTDCAASWDMQRDADALAAKSSKMLAPSKWNASPGRKAADKYASTTLRRQQHVIQSQPPIAALMLATLPKPMPEAWPKSMSPMVFNEGGGISVDLWPFGLRISSSLFLAAPSVGASRLPRDKDSVEDKSFVRCRPAIQRPFPISRRQRRR